MIFLTKLDKSRVLVAIETIKFIESAPDTLVRFINGDMLIVCETQDEIAEKVIFFKSRCISSGVDKDSKALHGKSHEAAAN